MPVETSENDLCYAAAIRILKYRFNSIAELRRKLSAKKFDRAAIDAAVERLKSEKWLDDERYAGAFARTRILKNIGPQRIRRELMAAGVTDEVAGRAVGENLDNDRKRENAVALCEKKMRMIARRHGVAYLHTDDGRKKLAAYLLNHGYEASVVFDTIDECMKLR